MPDEARHSNKFLVAAIIVSILVIILTGRGVWICGWPEPGQVAPEHPRKGYATNEILWRQLKAKETNDTALWNEQCGIVLLYPPEERAAAQEQWIKEGSVTESSRIRMLTPTELAEMEKRVAEVQSSNAALDFGQIWAFFGIPLNLLALLLTFLAFWRAYGCRNHGRQLIFVATLFAMNGLSLLLTLRNAAGTSFD